MRDLVVLAADSQIEQTMLGLLPRHAALGIQPIDITKNDVKVHPQRDSGCRVQGVEVLRQFQRQYRHALLVFDREGSGENVLTASQIQDALFEKFNQAGWNGKARAVVLNPELETLVWSQSPHVDTALGWSGQVPDLRTWLTMERWINSRAEKPVRPKEAMEAAMRHVRKKPSAAIFRELAESVGLRNCVDPSFVQLLETLRAWYPLPPPGAGS